MASASRNERVRLWDAETGHEIGPLRGHSGAVYSFSFSSDGWRVVSDHWDRTLRLWNVERHIEIGDSFDGHTGSVCCISFSADELRVVSGFIGQNWTDMECWQAPTNRNTVGAIIYCSERVRDQ